MKKIIFLALLATLSSTLHAQEVSSTARDTVIQTEKETYAYITVTGKAFSSKLKINIDLGIKPEQTKLANEYLEQVKDEKSHAAVLNYMAEQGFVLIQALDYSKGYNTNGETTGIWFIMKKTEDK